MTIWLDLRLTSNDNLFSAFIVELTKEIIKNNKEVEFTIYCNNNDTFKDIENSEKVTIKNVGIKNWSIQEQTTFYKILKKDKNELMVFFDYHKPIFYRKHFVLLVNSLENIYYQNFDTLTTKQIYLLLLKSALKRADKIICFDGNTVDELSERFNIKETKVSVIKSFFPWINSLNKDNLLKLETKNKYNIKKDFFIYSSWIGIQKNIERLLSLIKRLKDSWKAVDLVFLGNDVSKELYIREVIIEQELQNEIHFLWEIKNDEKRNLYSESLWTIIPSFYEPFPFSLTDSVISNSPIISSNIESIKQIFNDTISYFSPISTSDLEKSILLFLDNKKPEKNITYDSIIKKYNKENTSKEFLKIIAS